MKGSLFPSVVLLVLLLTIAACTVSLEYVKLAGARSDSIQLHSLLLPQPISISALPSSSLIRPRAVNLPSKDGTYTDSQLKMRSAITCPNDVKGRKGGVVLLVHGTALDGESSWPQSPFVQLLPNAGPGFDGA